MTHVRPELLFLTGPQAGQRSVIMTDVALAGRSPSADLTIIEQYVSREHLRFALTAEGWTVESLSPHGMRVSGRKYKPGKSLILETGDVVAVGDQTQMLFVAPGDDPEEALRAYRQAHPEAFEPRAAEAPKPPPPAPTPAEAPAGAAAPAKAREAATPPLPADLAAAEEALPQAVPVTAELEVIARRRKYRRYAIFGAIYLLAFVGFIIFAAGRKRQQVVADTPPPKLNDDQLADAIKAPLESFPNPLMAADALRKALALYEGSRFSGQLYQAVKQFKFYQAYKGSPGFDRSEDEMTYERAWRELTAEVAREYGNGWAHEKARNWQKAKQSFERVLDLVPERDASDPTHRILVVNVRLHISYVRRQAEK